MLLPRIEIRWASGSRLLAPLIPVGDAVRYSVVKRGADAVEGQKAATFCLC